MHSSRYGMCAMPVWSSRIPWKPQGRRVLKVHLAFQVLQDKQQGVDHVALLVLKEIKDFQVNEENLEKLVLQEGMVSFR
ncbi:hypothetical protein OSTOST_10895 [Ostertagia ostertagi]